MQLLGTDDAYYIKSSHSLLKCCRSTANLSIFKHSDLPSADFELIANIFCFVGKIVVDDGIYLLLVNDCTEITKVGHEKSPVRKINKICALRVKTGGEMRLIEFCPSLLTSKPNSSPKSFANLIASRVNNIKSPGKLIDDILAFFNQSTSFYFSNDIDITRTLQSIYKNPDNFEERFFWNRNLLKDFFVSDGTPIPAFKEWIVPIIYGHIDQKQMIFDNHGSEIMLTLISRRSAHRAGVRYLRRGIDTDGNVANFVETELILTLLGHNLSFVQCRGSVPIFWSQEINYQLRPPMKIDCSLEESLPYFQKHIKQLLGNYGSPLILINLVDQEGKEKKLGESYFQHVMELGSEEVQYHPFDFHRICGVRRTFEIRQFVNSLEQQLKKIGFCWIDKTGKIALQQHGVVRTNCVDCLDRTNVIQGEVSLTVCSAQTRKLGLVEPTDEIPQTFIAVLQRMWADHGDSVSQQYAGTNALKSDITRNGKRKFTGLMKDGYNSVSRYCISRFSDSQRQKIIDIILDTA